MADPGTAVGVVSLGLQITQGLLEYYSNYKTYSDDIAHAVQRIKYLHETLAALEIPLQKLETRGDTVSERVRVSVRNCDHVLMKLDEVVRKCGEVPASQSVVTKMKMVEKRLVYPLRKGTLRDVSTWVDRAQNDLDTALHALQLKVSVESQEEMTRYAVSFDHRLAAIQFGQLNTMQSLHSLHQASNINAQQTHFVAQNLEGISLQQQQISQQMSTLMQITTAIANQKLLAPSTISQGMAAAEELATLKVPNYQNANIEPRQSFLYPPSFRPSNRCTCSNSLFNRKSVRWDRSLSLFWRSESTHDSWCPLSRTRQKSDSVGARIRYGASMFTYIVEFTLNSTRGAGGYSMSQGLNIRRVVPDTNPAFRLFDYYSSLWFESPEAVKRSLDQYLRDGIVSATDVNERGHTLSQAACSYLYINSKTQPSLGAVLDLFKFLISAGVPGTSDTRGLTALDELLRNTWEYDTEGFAYLCSYLVERGYTWSADELYRFPWTYAVEGISIIKSLSNFRVFGQGFEGDPLIRAIIMRSNSDLEEQLQNMHFADEERLGYAMTASCDWPEGVRLLLQHDEGSISWMWYVHSLMGAYSIDNFETADLLIEAGVEITGYLLRYVSEISERHEEAMHHAIHVLKYQLDSEDEARPTEIFDELEPVKLDWVFHLVDRRKFADALYNAGFQALDTTLTRKSYLDSGTPLWELAKDLFIQPFLLYFEDEDMAKLQLIQWFMDNGAQKEWIHPHFRTTPAHMLASIPFRLSVSYLFLTQLLGEAKTRNPSLIFIRQFFNSHCWWNLHVQLMMAVSPDRCCCACSRGGCLPITCTFKDIFGDFAVYDSHYRPNKPVSAEDSFDYILSWMDPLLSTSLTMANAVIRVLTFEKLGIRHTCQEMEILMYTRSNPSYKYMLEPDPLCAEEERNELHEEDAELIAKLEDLTAEFEAAYASSENPSFYDFYKEHWMSRMKEVLEEMDQVTEEYADTVEKLGVVLKPFGPVPPPGMNRITEVSEEDGDEFWNSGWYSEENEY